MSAHKKSVNHLHFFIALLLAVFILALYMLRGYYSLIFTSFFYSVLIYPFYAYVYRRFRQGVYFSSLVTILITFFAIIIPFLIILGIVAKEAVEFQRSTTRFVNGTTLSVESITKSINSVIGSLTNNTYQVEEETIEKSIHEITGPFGSFLAGKLLAFGTYSFGLTANLFIFIILVYFIVPHIPYLGRLLRRLSPLPDSVDKLYAMRVIAMTKAMIKGTFLVALIQGILAGILLFIVGVPYTLILTIIMTLFALVPVLSTNLVTIPIAVYFLLAGEILKGISIILVQVVIISTIDNILRPLFASGEGHMNPGLLLVAILGGIHTFGFMGIFYGPIIMIFLTTSIEVYLNHYAPDKTNL